MITRPAMRSQKWARTDMTELLGNLISTLRAHGKSPHRPDGRGFQPMTPTSRFGRHSRICDTRCGFPHADSAAGYCCPLAGTATAFRMSSSRLGASVVAFLAGCFTGTAVECPRAFDVGMAGRRDVERAREGVLPIATGTAVWTGGSSRGGEGRGVTGGEAPGRAGPGEGSAAPRLAGAR